MANPNTIRLLVVEDNYNNYRAIHQVLKTRLPGLIKEKISDAVISLDIQNANSQDEALKFLTKNQFDGIIIMDYELGNTKGTDVITKILELYPNERNFKIFAWSDSYPKDQIYGDGRIHSKPLTGKDLVNETVFLEAVYEVAQRLMKQETEIIDGEIQKNSVSESESDDSTSESESDISDVRTELQEAAQIPNANDNSDSPSLRKSLENLLLSPKKDTADVVTKRNRPGESDLPNSKKPYTSPTN